MSDTTLSFANSSSFRNFLMGKNLVEYSIPGRYSPPAGPRNFEVVLSNSPVLDAPNDGLSDDLYADKLYPLNRFGPTEGYDTEININNPPIPVISNQGEYNPNDTNMDLLNEFFIDLAYITNKYGPNDGYQDMVTITDIQNNTFIYQPYWSPPSFRPSTYSPIEILNSKDPNGSNGPVSQDSFIASFGAKKLRDLFQETIDSLSRTTNLGVTQINSFSQPFLAQLYSSGQRGVSSLNFHVTVQQIPLANTGGLTTTQSIQSTTGFIQNVSGQNYPASPIPGDYFQDQPYKNDQTPETLIALSTINSLTGGLLGPTLKLAFNPSKIFLENTGSGQKAVLFSSLKLNRYQPNYEKDPNTQFTVGQNVIGTLAGLGGLGAFLQGGYYVGSPNAEPSMVSSPPNQVPVNSYGQQDPSPVYGPQELGILYEGQIPKLGFTFAPTPQLGQEEYKGQFVWTSPKYTGNAGFKATPGGGTGNVDDDYNQISSDYQKNQSTQFSFRPNSILDKTQKLINSGDLVGGGQRLKHIGNAINQVSKVFNDGYKEITKGNKALSYIDNATGQETGVEYCRVFTKDTPYYTYRDLVRHEGMTKSNRALSYSVLDNTFNLNIAPSNQEYGSTNIVDGKVKKYMFSIENLAWRTSSRPGFTYDDLPYSEKGPNGGRIMWFPPYDIKFDDKSTSNFNKTSFLGRPEPIYTYKDTYRSGTLSWKIIVDEPSILDLIASKQLKNTPQEKVDSIIESFFAGCAKYDIYDLAKRFNTFKLSELVNLQELLNSPTITETELIQIKDEIPVENIPVTIETKTPIKPVGGNVVEIQKFDDFAFYFDNDVPSKPNEIQDDFQSLLQTYLSQKTKYQTNANNLFNSGDENSKTDNFFTIIENNFKSISEGEKSFVKQVVNFLKDTEGTLEITLQGSASAVANPTYNINLSKRRIDNIKKFFDSTDLKEFIDNQRIIYNEIAEGEGTVIPKDDKGNYKQITCTEEVKSKTGQFVRVFSVDNMACRRVKITTKFTPSSKPKPEKLEDENKEKITSKVDGSGQVKTKSSGLTKITTPSKPKNLEDIKTKLRKGLAKKIIRKLLTEGDYFQVLQKENPFIYDSLKQKLKYFSPVFHSMTPEGLNSRLTFLNQCVRPGETIPVIGPDNTIRTDNALNTSFGTPPILVLRIGDFYHTKIVPSSIGFTYDPVIFDLNPEGIGVQPMIASVTMSFDFIGGMGLANPVEQLQNALSFNFYANTEVYDERAVETDTSLSKIDKDFFDSLLQGEESLKAGDAGQAQTNKCGDTIGTILSTDNIQDGQSGTTSFMAIMDSLINQSQLYYTTIVNQLEKIQQITNYGVVQLVTKERKFTKGKFGNKDGVLFGKPDNLNKQFSDLFDLCKKDIRNTSPGTKNPILVELKNRLKIEQKDERELIGNMTIYIDNLSKSFPNDIQLPVNVMTNVQTDLIQIIRRLNLINEKLDGKIIDTGDATIYRLTETSDVSKKSKPTFSNTFMEFQGDYEEFQIKTNSFVEDTLTTANIIKIFKDTKNPGYSEAGNPILIKPKYLSNREQKTFFMIMARILTNKSKKEDFINSVFKGPVSKNNKLKRKFTSVVDDFADAYESELKEETTIFTDFKKSFNFNNYEKNIETFLFNKGKTRKFDYTTVPTGTKSEKDKFLQLCNSVNGEPIDEFTNKSTLN